MKTPALLLLALLAGCTPQMAALAPSFTSQGMSLLMQQETASRQAALAAATYAEPNGDGTNSPATGEWSDGVNGCDTQI